MVAGDEDGLIGSGLGTAVVLMKIAERAVFHWYGHDFYVMAVAGCLEVAADDEQVDAGPTTGLAGGTDGGVDGIECTMTLYRGKKSG